MTASPHGHAAMSQLATPRRTGLAARLIAILLAVLTLTLANAQSAQARFLSPDPWDPWIQGVDINRYAYANNDPINLSDPNGHVSGYAGQGTKCEESCKKQREQVTKWLKDIGVSLVPGSNLKDAYEAYQRGDIKWAMAHAAIGVADVTFTVATFGTGSAVTTGVKEGTKLTTKIAAKKVSGEVFEQTARTTTRFVDGVTVTDKFTGKSLSGTVDLQPTIDRIASGGKHPHKNDGSTFFNSEGSLPAQPEGYYKEYVVPTPGVNGPGPQRIIRGGRGEMFYSPDHYKTFIPIN